MHIELNLKITLNDEQRTLVHQQLQTKLQLLLRQFVFEAAESAGIFHRDIEIDGDVKVVDEPYIDPEPQVTYCHSSSLDGRPRFRQYAKDPLPAWAVDVKPLVV